MAPQDAVAPMNEQLISRIRQCSNLPSLPAIAIQVLELAQKTDVDIAEIARTISKDPALSTKILRTVNSSFYARSQHVSTISHALVILGLQSVKTLVLGFSLVTNLMRGKEKGFKHIDSWRRSDLFRRPPPRTISIKPDQSGAAGRSLPGRRLLKDIGMLILDQVLGAEYGEINNKASSHMPTCPAFEARSDRRPIMPRWADIWREVGSCLRC